MAEHYITDSGTYDVSLLSEEAQSVWVLLKEVAIRQNNLQKELAITSGAGKSFTATLNSMLTKDALVDIDTDEPALPDPEVLEDTSREI